MGNDTSRAVGTDFDANQRTRDRDNAAEDLPSFNVVKTKKFKEELGSALSASVFFNNYKRAFRGYLRKKPETNQMGAMLRTHHFSLRDADLLGLPRDRLNEVVDQVVIKLAPELNEDCIEFLVERKKIKASDSDERKQRISEETLKQIFMFEADTIVERTGRKIYEKYSRGADFEASDTEMDPETAKRLAAQKEARLKKAAEERQRQAEQFAREAAEEEERQAQREEAVRKRQEEQKAIELARAQQQDADML